MPNNEMSPQNGALQLLSIKQLFEVSSQYVIPIYQRNYAWGATEIEQLIQDIYDASAYDANLEKHYFLGSLIVYPRETELSNHKSVYETIDGQQRHTTLAILLAFLKNNMLNSELGLEGLTQNLIFASRPMSVKALQNLYNNEANGDPEEPKIYAAYDIIARYFKASNLNTERFCRYLLEKVSLLRVSVPYDTDLNHYFEIMNNRGEQLEKHEVLKARLMSECAENISVRDCFSAIWDACANMNRYVQLNFGSSIRSAIFGEDWCSFPSCFKDIQANFTESKQFQNSVSLKGIIAGKGLKNIGMKEEVEQEVKFNSIIDFSNFLLHVLKVTTDSKVSLDDKKLLEAFYSPDKKLKVEPTEFVFNLLKYRALFDRYIIKRDSEEKWSLLMLIKYSKSSSYLNSFGKDEVLELNQQLVMILSMFHVSSPALAYKRWLNKALEILGKLACKNDLDVDGEIYLQELENLSNHYLEKICGAGDQFNESVLHQGTSVQNFIFNRLDYLLWKNFLKSEHAYDFNRLELSKHFEEFEFIFRTSVEHYFPQTDPSGAKGMENVDRFGNLCLISPSSNSRLSNYSPADKKKFYRENNRVESLKQAIMMSYKNWGPEETGIQNIEKHESAMIDILRKPH